ncbi:hypothetical protein INT45_013285 [Circinella minor]|uniref:Reverse transcriptase domain-containing protein n=1 Tax=Circinella minor TaxID=1195481 RepID=A0A8H7V7G6_9FUNG|nr:hypothetical protein INT45_013285 [Circinella minor]
MHYTAPQAIPAAVSREDSTLRHLQYQLSAVFRPFDVLANELLQILPQDQLARFFIILRDTCTLLMHANGSINQARNHLALRTINPSFSAINNNTTYTMATDIFQTTVSQQASAQRALRDARPRFRRSLPNNSVTNQTNSSSATTPTNNSHFFRQGGPLGGAQQLHQPAATTSTRPFKQQHQQQLQQHQSLIVSGRLSLYSATWARLSHSPWLHSVIKHGFKIHFDRPPPLSSQPRLQPKLNYQQQQLLQQEIDQLIQKRALEPVYDPSPGFYSQMFVIPKKNGGHRPICNLKPLNQFLTAPAFKMETIQEVLRMIRPSDYMTSIDLTDAFLYLKIHKSSRHYLRIFWNNQVYQFRTAIFGLSLVPWLFTKITKPILSWARQQNIRLSAYLDDWIILGRTAKQVQQHTQQIIQKLHQLGWIINTSKSATTPQQQLQHLRFQINTTTMTLQLPGDKVRSLRRSIDQMIKCSHTTRRKLLSLTMRIQSATLSIFLTRLYTQHLLRFTTLQVKHRSHWDSDQLLPHSCKMELLWWKENLIKWNGRSFIPDPVPSQIVTVDASNTGYGIHWKHHRLSGLWTHLEASYHINWKEMRTVQLALQTFPQHIPGNSNSIADYESRRTFAKNSWKINHQTLLQIQHHWGHHDIDLFADRTTHLLPRYVSWKPDPTAIATDAFTLTWSTFLHPLIHLPWNLISRCLLKIIHEQVPLATVIVPYWPSAPWFPQLQSIALHQPLLFNPSTTIELCAPITPWPFNNPMWRLSIWLVSGADMMRW